MIEQDASGQLSTLEQHLRNGRHDEALAVCARLMTEPKLPVAQLLTLSHAFQRLGKFSAMLVAARRAADLDSENFNAQMRFVESLIYTGDIATALHRLGELETRFEANPDVLQDIAQMYLHCAGHMQACRCYERAVQLQPAHAPYLYNLASSYVALGKIAQAEALFDQVLVLAPSDMGAYLNRSMLKTWTPETQHVDALSRMLQDLPANHPGEVPLSYALAKEYEDLGEAEKSFAFVKRGADRRRSMLAYKVANDVAAMEKIAEVFDASLLAGAKRSDEVETSFFVMGLPRSGTTLVDRILSSHSQVASLGEITNFVFALMQLASGSGGKFEMIQRSAQIDFSRLGQIYRDGIKGYGNTAVHLINKTPDNFLYLGLIHLALPNAKVVHLRRHPLDSCYAMYKTLFRMGYPFSYSLDDLGHYYLAYHQLMAHWRKTIPDSFVDIDYETLVSDQKGATRTLLEYCGLPWEAACLSFHENASPAATASAAQVRRPVYRDSVQRWRQYADQLSPLANFLSNHGIDCS